MKSSLTTGLTHNATRRVTARELVPQVYPDHAVFASLPPVFATAEVQIAAIDDRKITFNITVHDEQDIISTGTHTRFVISQEKFLAKVAQKAA